MDALGKFLSNRPFSLNDLTLSNRALINSIGNRWESQEYKFEDSIEIWEPVLPTIDIWLDVSNCELQHVYQIIPTLDWECGLLGTRLIYQPRKLEEIYFEYRDAYFTARSAEATRTIDTLVLWPKNLSDFLERKLHEYFGIKAYLLNP